MQVQSSPLTKIADLEHTRQALLNQPNDTDDAVFHNNARIARLAEIKAELDRLWNEERQYRANRRCNQNQPGK